MVRLYWYLLLALLSLLTIIGILVNNSTTEIGDMTWYAWLLLGLNMIGLPMWLAESGLYHYASLTLVEGQKLSRTNCTY